MTFIEPMHRNKPNITYLLLHFTSISRSIMKQNYTMCESLFCCRLCYVVHKFSADIKEVLHALASISYYVFLFYIAVFILSSQMDQRQKWKVAMEENGGKADMPNPGWCVIILSLLCTSKKNSACVALYIDGLTQDCNNSNGVTTVLC